TRALRHVPLDVYRLLPVDPVAVANQQGDRRAGRPPVADTREDLCAVAFDGHSSSAAVAALPPAELLVERIDVELESRRHAVDGNDERLAVRFAGGEKPEHSWHCTKAQVTRLKIQ